MIEMHIAVGITSQSECIATQVNIPYLRKCILQDAIVVIKGNTDHCSTWLADAKHIAMLQKMVEVIGALVLLPLIGETIHRPHSLSLWMHKVIETIALLYLKMVARNKIFVNADITTEIAPDAR
jgi:hypothetical protein